MGMVEEVGGGVRIDRVKNGGEGGNEWDEEWGGGG